MADKKNISSTGAGFSREDIHNYGTSSDQRMKHDIEMRSNESGFEQDAFDGWDALNYDLSAMKRLDKRFMKSNFSWFNVSLVLVTIVSVSTAIFFWMSSNTTEKTNQVGTEIANQDGVSEPVTIAIDEEDIVLDVEIQEMTEAVEPEQINVVHIQSEQKSIDSFQLAKLEVDTVQQLKLLPTEPVDRSTLPELMKSKMYGKEVYLNDLKLLDYREYRSRPEVKTKQLVLTGTSADKEYSNSEGQTSEWRDVQIPYIDYIDKTTRLFSRNSFKKALDRCETILKTYPDDINALFYGGICLYNLKEYDKAMDYFSKVRNTDFSNFDEESLWLIANCLEKSGSIEKAKLKYQEIAREGGFYAKQALERLKK